MERIETLDRVIPLVLKDSCKHVGLCALTGFICGVAIKRPFSVMWISAGISSGYNYHLANLYLKELINDSQNILKTSQESPSNEYLYRLEKLRRTYF